MMHIRVLVTIILCFIVLSSTVAAYTLDSVEIRDYLSDTKNLKEEMILQLSNNTKESILMHLPDKAYNVFLDGTAAVIENNSLNVNTLCENCKITISYELKNVIKEPQSNVYDFSRTMNLPTIPKTLYYSITLPPGNTINVHDDTSIVPNDAKITTDGQGIIITWLEQNPKLPKIYHLSYKDHESTEAALETFNELKEITVLLMLCTVLFIGIALGWLFKKTYDAKLQLNITEMEIPSTMFSPDEKELLQCIKKNDGKIRQKELGIQLHWSKSKVSAVVSNLEYKQIIRREKIGRNYDIYLKTVIKE